MPGSDSETDYAIWSDPETSFRVAYPLPLFYEIDFAVNETYRRIPRGGIEIGALLFGRSQPGGVRIEAFRAIHCDHALGPSFKLSESDLATLRKQLQAAQAEEETGGPQVLGWFIAHTRNPLELNAAEVALFDELMPGAGKLTLLIKPEKFKPTLFAFVVRREDGQLPQSLEERTLVLPLTAPVGQSGEEASTGGAEVAQGSPAPLPAAPEVTGTGRTRNKANIPPPEPPNESNTPPSAPQDPHIAAVRKAVISARQMASAEPVPPPGVERVREPVERGREPVERESPPQPVRPQRSIATDLPEAGPHISPNLPVPVEPAWPIDAYPAPTFDAGTGDRAVERRAARLDYERSGQSKLQFAAVMIVAAALGCALGYLAYLQLPSPVIPLNIQPESAGLTVYWPPEQTRHAVYAAIRINDGEPVPLPGDAKSAGHSRLTATGDVIKVELIAQHWMRDSRGIVRFVAPVKQPQPPASAATNAKPRRRTASRTPLEIPRPEEPR